MKRKIIRGICLILIGGTMKISAQAHPDRQNRALEQLRSGVWMERGGLDLFETIGGASDGPNGAVDAPGRSRFVAAGWETPQLSLLPLTPGVSLEPPTQTPIPIEAKPIEVVIPVEGRRAVVPLPKHGLSPCQDLRKKAVSLRNAASQCDTDIANGHPYCNVAVVFDSPSIPRSLSAEEARSHAVRFERVANGASENACADFGGQGDIPSYDMSRRRADEHYGRLCAGGDHYACNARQIEELCFASSPVNDCVRNCLVTKDDACLSGSASALSNCRVISHFQCYYSCRKPVPSIPEGYCFSQLPGWSSFK